MVVIKKWLVIIYRNNRILEYGDVVLYIEQLFTVY